MTELLLILCVVIWIPVLLHQVAQRGLVILLMWLFIAPIATNLVMGRSDVFFTTPEALEDSQERRIVRKARWARTGIGYATDVDNLKMRNLFEPTRIIIGAFVIVFLLGAVLKKAPLVPLDKTEIWMAVFSVIAVANVLMMSQLAAGLRLATDAFIVPFLGYYVTRRLVTSEDRFRQLIQVLGYVAVYIIVLCLIERLVHGELLYRLRGPMGGVPQLHIVLSTLFFAVVIGKEFLRREVRLFVLYLAPVIVLLTWQRANWVGFLAGVWVFMFLARRLTESSRKLRAMGLALMFIPIIVITIQAVRMERIEARVGNVGNVEFRLERWRIAIEEVTKQPVFGIGLNNLRPIYLQKTGGYGGSHNSFVSFFAELGAIGLLAYLAIVASIIRMGFRLYRMGPHSRDWWRGIAVVALMAAYQTGALFYSYLHATQVSQIYVYVFLGGIAGLYSREHLAHPALFRSSLVTGPYR